MIAIKKTNVKNDLHYHLKFLKRLSLRRDLKKYILKHRLKNKNLK